MGRQGDQRLPSERIQEPSSPPPPPPYRPPLPPRETNELQQNSEPVPGVQARPTTLSWADQDPRNASTESLVPGDGTAHRRVLLMIYVHGFVGDETSFQSFPAHIHNIATQLVSETHAVHTKIYPRYKSRRAIQYARDDFSRWLSPHESPDTDIILLGHSMGGILSADAVLLPPYSPENRDPFYHRILGTINFDTPFLGMHPGVIKSGIGSIFRPAPPNARPGPENHASNENVFLPMHSEGGSQVSTLALSTVSSPPSSPYTTPTDDPNYNPPFANDVHIPVRKRWNNALHFLNKHSDDLAHAAKTYVTSHFEFGGAMADYRTLNNRYKKLRGLEDIDDSRGVISSSYRQVRRVRFVNYYTACTGRLKGKATEKDKKFCMLPERGSGGEIDPTWVRVFMEGCDEVGAHCGLFFPENPHYEKLVVDVGHKVQEWIILNR